MKNFTIQIKWIDVRIKKQLYCTPNFNDTRSVASINCDVKMSEGVITPICEADLENVLALQKIAFGRVAALVNKPDMPSMVQTVDEVKEEAGRGTILKYVVDGDRIVGSVRAYCDEQNVCRIGKLVVHPQFENRGIGKALMGEIERCFRQCAKFALFTGQVTPNTFHLYSKLGYREVDRQVMSGVAMFIMEKENCASREQRETDGE